MYKQLEFEELYHLKSGFFTTFAKIIADNRYPTLREYIRDMKRRGPEVLHFARQGVIRRTVFEDDKVIFYDEQEQIELHADTPILSKLASILKDPKRIARQKRQSVSLEHQLLQRFEEGEFAQIQGKDYLVYDIETSYASDDVKKTEFYVGYAYIVKKGKGSYRSIEADNLPKFLDYLVEFDGYIIGYNSLAFDNPVTVNQWLVLSDRYSDEEYERILDIINKKSLDLFQFVRGLTSRRIGLNKISTALVWLAKTLDSGKEAQWLWEAYQEGDEKAFKTLMRYCRNDVKMTYLTLWYILDAEEIGREDQSYPYTMEDFFDLSNKENEFLFPGQEAESVRSESIFA